MKPFLYKCLALIMAVLALFLIGFGLFPILSPLGFAFSIGAEYYFTSILSFPASFLVMYLAWRLSSWAQKPKHEQEGRSVKQKPC